MMIGRCHRLFLIHLLIVIIGMLVKILPNIIIITAASIVTAIPQCSFTSPTYNLDWKYDSTAQSVVFNLSARLPPRSNGGQLVDFWTGVGFGTDMVYTDCR
jgi:hypothetical protein